MINFKPHNTKPETWPQERTDAHRIIEKYKAKLAMQNNDVKDMRSTSSLAIRDATNATTSHSTSSHEPNKKMKLDLSFSDSYDSETRGQKLHADYNAMNPEEAMDMEMQYQDGSAKLPENELVGDDEGKLASLEAKLHAITKRIASMEANYF